MRIAVAKGDGIGPEIMDAVLNIFDANKVPLEYGFVEMGKWVFDRGFSNGMAPEGRQSIESVGLLFKGPMETPKGKVIDLGTSFGTSVTDSGETETQVFEGKVRIHPLGERQGTILLENEKLAVGEKGAVKSTGVADSGFVTSLPPRSGTNISFIHWPMDEGAGDQVGA
jgi:hypothetical protein